VTTDPVDGFPTIQRMTPQDWRQLRSIRLHALMSEPASFGTSWEHDRSMSPASWQETLSANVWLRASTSRTSVGGIVAFFPDDTSPDGAPQLGSMWVEPSQRRTGVGRALCAEVAAHAHRAGAHSLGLWVVDGNHAAARAYERLGFRSSGDGKPAPRDPNVVMHRMLLPL
jgi:RimJ/RimL family protein N-acetyltransferase